MKNEIKHNNFENGIKQKLDSFEYPFDANKWNDLKKKLPKKSFYASKSFYAIVSLLFIGSIMYFSVLDKKDSVKTKKVIFEKEIVHKTQNSGHKTQPDIINTTNTTNTNKEIRLQTIKTNKTCDNTPNAVKQNQEIKQAEIKHTAKTNQNTTKTINKNNTVKINKQTKTPDASYFVSSDKGCEPVSIKFTPAEISDTIIYLWEFDDGTFSNEVSPVHEFKKAGKYKVNLTVKYFHSDNIRMDSGTEITVFATPKADFEYRKENNIYTFTGKAKNTDNFEWYINDNYFNTAVASCEFNKDCICKVVLICNNDNGCSDTLTKNIKIQTDHIIFMPNAFRPNGDGINDTFGPVTNDIGNKEFYFRIVNGLGQTVFESHNINHHWDGKIKNTGMAAKTGKYAWEILIKDSGKIIEHKTGYVTLQK